MKLTTQKKVQFAGPVTWCLMTLLMVVGCGKKSVPDESGPNTNAPNVVVPDGQAPVPNPVPEMSPEGPPESLFGYVTYQTEEGTHLEGISLVTKRDKVLRSEEVRIVSDKIDSLAIKIQVPENLTERVGSVQNALLRNAKFEHAVQISELSFTREQGTYFLTFKVSGLQYAGLLRETFVNLRFSLSTIYGKPFRTIQIDCSFGLRFPRKRQK